MNINPMNMDSLLKWHEERQKFNENFYKEKNILQLLKK